MDKQQKSPIVAERDGPISKASAGTKKEPYKAKKPISEDQGLSSAWKAVALISLLGLLAVSWVGWQQYQAFTQLHERFEILDSRLNNTDESVNQSGAAMQINISKQSDQLKKHWSEIRKLWGIANDKNKGKIASNAKDFARYGKLFKDHGKWNGKQILDSAFVAKSITPRFKESPEYGYGWWLKQQNGKGFFMMRGHLGQYVIVQPEDNVIIVRLGHSKGPGDAVGSFTPDISIYIEEAYKMLLSEQQLQP